MTISKDGFEMSGNATLKIMNPFNSAIESAIIYTDFVFSASAKMIDGNKITGFANDLSLNVTGLRPLFDSQETVHTISTKMKGV
jgi:hypothetical protein